MHENRAASGEVTIRLHAAGRVEVTGNDQELERVLSNLLGNAVKFSPPGSRIDVQVGQVGDDAVLCVRDQGLGISEADQRQLFDRFFRASNALASGIPGTGLGLAITKQIVTKHRGTIAVSSEVGRGSTFTVTLPRDFRHVRPPVD
jgi:signal transduction histidine kinase